MAEQNSSRSPKAPAPRKAAVQASAGKRAESGSSKVVANPPTTPEASGPAASAPAQDQEASASERTPITMADLRSTGILLLFFVATILLAVVFARPFSAGCEQPEGERTDACLRAVENPDDPTNVAWYIGLILVFTFIILYIAKTGKKWLIRLIILGAVATTVAYVLYFLAAAPSAPLPHILVGTDWLGQFDAVAMGIGVGVAALATVALYKHPEWYVIDGVGLLVAAASATIFGISFGLVPVVLLLTGLAIYDAIAVYRTKHMLALADSVIELQLPVLLVIPKHRGYRFRWEKVKVQDASPENKAEREAMFMGLGDLVMPTMLVVSALTFLPASGITGAWDGFVSNLPAMGAAVGTLVGFGVLMAFVLRGNPQAGLPLLNGGAMAGFFAGLYWATGSLQFW